MRWLDSITHSIDMNEQTPGDHGGQRTWHAADHGVTNSQTQLSDWTIKQL